ncbi:helix-turn-helix transcriptional regulator [Raoultella ornithinolytica]|uniref:helix-turn-helix transcriptional regulator n=1 Tax=Raoultella ornithinolytica TaxID=54291 RepID=UPI0007DADA6A|nr:LuxR C-terminal-related transcriptional regulator [Raoultella ornithinolytica]
MLPGHDQCGIIISKIPVMQSGLKTITSECLPDYIFSCCRSPEELTLTELGRTRQVIVDLSGDLSQPQEVCEYYCFLMSQYKDIHWVYIVGRASDRAAQIFLVRDNSTLVSDMAPVVRLGAAICAAEARCPEDVSVTNDKATFLNTPTDTVSMSPEMISTLTLSERKVLRLLAKGWGINQIASLLKKSNKTISAQKNSAMRRLSLNGNAQMYAWINSEQGMKELNIYSEHGELQEWRSVAKRNALLSSNRA